MILNTPRNPYNHHHYSIQHVYNQSNMLILRQSNSRAAKDFFNKRTGSSNETIEMVSQKHLVHGILAVRSYQKRGERNTHTHIKAKDDVFEGHVCGSLFILLTHTLTCKRQNIR